MECLCHKYPLHKDNSLFSYAPKNKLSAEYFNAFTYLDKEDHDINDGCSSQTMHTLMTNKAVFIIAYV